MLRRGQLALSHSHRFRGIRYSCSRTPAASLWSDWLAGPWKCDNSCGSPSDYRPHSAGYQSGLIHKDIKPAIIESQDARIGVIRKLSSTSPTWRVLPLNAS
jgi:hypothetical protein